MDPSETTEHGRVDTRIGPADLTRFRAKRLAEVVANDLRRKIVTGELGDGGELPRQDDLLVTYGVSKPSLREALRILESEGLISVRRGKRGGAIVHRPDLNSVAHPIGMVLESQGVPVLDLSTALNLLEPQCVALCAQRPDRHTEVLPQLRRIHEEATAAIDDVERFTVVSRRFHEALVTSCGNYTLTLVVGALEAVWSAHARDWVARGLNASHLPDREYREQGLDDHQRLLGLIADGDHRGAAEEAARHLRWAPVYTSGRSDELPGSGAPSGPFPQ